jgi:hypothetical protein
MPDIDEGLKLCEAATPGEWIVTNQVVPLGTVYYQRVSILSAGKANASYPQQPGIVAQLESTRSFRPYKSLSDADARLIAYAGTHLKAILLQIQALRSLEQKLRREADEKDIRYPAEGGGDKRDAAARIAAIGKEGV